MTRVVILMTAVLLSNGCGMFLVPMPRRLDTESQGRVDRSWEHMMGSIDKLDHQLILDVLVSSQAYQLGVDKIYFRSEKKFSGGCVKMEILFDVEKPDDDLFRVTILDKDENEIRRDLYSRSEVERTGEELLSPRFVPGDPENKSEKVLAEEEKLKMRLERVMEVFPCGRSEDSDGSQDTSDDTPGKGTTP